MCLIIMDQSSLFNSFVCHLAWLSYLMSLYLNSFAFSEILCRELQLGNAFHSVSQGQGGKSRVSFTMSYYRETKVSGANCGTIKILSLLTKRLNISRRFNDM